jgi:hypothetical protein
MTSKVEEYLVRAAECEHKAQATEDTKSKSYFRIIAEHWRMMAAIVRSSEDDSASDTSANSCQAASVFGGRKFFSTQS